MGNTEYGKAADYAGARRMRRSFRFGVTACVLLTAMLWFSERYLRHERTESQYIAALTLEPQSARVFLRQAVKRDEEVRELPTPKYVAALAEREEDDLILPTYEKAYQLDPGNPSLALRYGCRLFKAGRYAEARERFRSAGEKPYGNALATYLEAATLPWTSDGDADVGGSLALVARANSSGNKVLPPEPLWSSALPKRGLWYARLSRQIVDECCAPLYQYTQLLAGQAQRQIALKQVQYWDSWLETLQDMGERLVKNETRSTLQAIAGIRIQLAAIEQREAAGKTAQGAAHSHLIERRVKLLSALDLLTAFEDARDERIRAEKARYVLPLHLCWKSVGLVSLCYLLAFCISKFVAADPACWAAAHTGPGVGVLLTGCGLLLAVLCAITVLQRHAEFDALWLAALEVAWWAALGLMLLFGLAHGPSALPGQAGESRRGARVVMVRRYWGALDGALLCVFSLWMVCYRVAFSLYPWQIELLTTGLMNEEADVVIEVVSLFQ